VENSCILAAEKYKLLLNSNKQASLNQPGLFSWQWNLSLNLTSPDKKPWKI